MVGVLYSSTIMELYCCELKVKRKSKLKRRLFFKGRVCYNVRIDYIALAGSHTVSPAAGQMKRPLKRRLIDRRAL